MHREAMSQLEKWKQSPYKKPLIIQGARQVGKTWLDFMLTSLSGIQRAGIKATPYLKSTIPAKLRPSPH